ncbi:hypothetical protein TD95_003996 [Thielaviopsis punctulata]|uniref:Nucleotide exchange factor SIL1 n=1 Tax=Thielaviopsis punctulata TaxID=72032 RepID=A0A0F4ZBS5_9PEZI|nr:hypothetical protein TD95_003996 [Thielaviopsis punctulata]
MHHRRQKRSIPTALGASLLLAFTSRALAAVPSPASESSATSSLICHTGNPAECYPKVFEPTDEFQAVREDQDLPPGLHVRMNIYTGLKEAKIYHPEEDTDAGSSAVAVDAAGAVLVVDHPEAQAEDIPSDGPMQGYYNPGTNLAKKAMPQCTAIFDALAKLHAGDVTEGNAELDAALESLKDISHDVFYGELMLTDYDTTAALMCFSFDPASAGISPALYPRDHMASYILAGALQNNPKALNEVMEKWERLSAHTCGAGRAPLGKKVFNQPLIAAVVDAEAVGDSQRAVEVAHKARSMVSLYSGLLQSPSFRAQFLAAGGMRHLLQLLLREETELKTAQRRAGQVVMDTFLDEDMGAKRGQWPLQAPLVGKEAETVCLAKETETSERCWDFHVERIMKKNKKDENHWSKALHEALKQERKLSGVPGKEEL